MNMKKVAVMQPYLFPYIGYWQLVNAVDEFVIFDDVNFIKKGWINRNTILLNGQPHRFTIPLDKPSQNKLIMETKLKFPNEEKERFLETLEMAYKRSPYFTDSYKLIKEIIEYDNDDLTDYIANSFNKICSYLGINTRFIRSSEICTDPELKGQNKVIAKCKALKANTYINPAGGRDLYDQKKFAEEGMQLYFIDTHMENIVYPQFQDSFVSGLSIIDLLMFNSSDRIRGFGNDYELNEH